MGRCVFNPFSLIMMAFLFVVLVILIPFLFLSVIGGAFAKLGFSTGTVLLLIVLTLIGSFVNLPLTTVKSGPVRMEKVYNPFYGWVYKIPEMAAETTVAINLGGALIPLLISLYLLAESVIVTGAYTVLVLSLVGVLIVTLVTNRVARPVPGLGIATPFFVPPLVALLVALVLALFAGGGDASIIAAPVIAYISGTLGTLIGADLLNLNRLGELGAPMVSIGGAGTFDGVFLTGVLAAFLA
ncbi:DUF1614 domain-containing protein [Methanofollis fontis]|uniref:DUF1614 domain-containing protein n=1 Tax=Methanofollis fontis TaxID=2052832 RepID=A0A483CZ59_9EURY|nr:DUF1614 domain-containing protein [Methanofollis fontis]TAJ45289.1 hypothetical protein CUJ86_00635 [Methanofollis fontis]